jgi:uncharacterized membrane protein
MLYAQKGGYLLLPVVIMLVLTLAAVLLPTAEERCPHFFKWLEIITWLGPQEPGMAQLFLGALAGSCITIVSVVYSILLIALTFASIQFSPRVLTSFVKDRVSQSTLGIFIGTFAYCLVLLPAVRTGASAFVPKASLALALLLGTLCLFYLIYFIHHIALAIQVNYIIDHVSHETAAIMRTVFGDPLKGFPRTEEPLIEPTGSVSFPSPRSGYIQFINEKKLLNVAIESDITIFVHRSEGQFVPAGTPCITISPAGKATREISKTCIRCFHIGPLRTMENDVEFGFLQLVDIALKAISPAVNDPSTAIACIDHLSALLLLAATLEPPTSRSFDNNGVVRIMRRQTSFPRLLDIAYNQIAPYGQADMAVSLRLMRALHDISGVTNYGPYLTAIRKHGERVVRACRAHFDEDDCKELMERWTTIETRQRSSV